LLRSKTGKKNKFSSTGTFYLVEESIERLVFTDRIGFDAFRLGGSSLSTRVEQKLHHHRYHVSPGESSVLLKQFKIFNSKLYFETKKLPNRVAQLTGI
jgi:hypothetical protein